MRKKKTLTEILRKAANDDERTIYALAKGSDIPYPVLWRFLLGQQGLTLETADRLVRILGLELILQRNLSSRKLPISSDSSL